VSAADADERLSRMLTLWSVVLRAADPSAGEAAAARERLLLRYRGAAYRYLLGAVRDVDAASDLCQEFAVRFLRGDFRRANPERGRFRDYVKTALVNLVNDYHRRRQKQPLPLAAEAEDRAADAASEADFVSSWREELLNQTWEALRVAQPVYHAVLLLRVEDEDMPSSEMAERLTQQLEKPMTPENVRKTLQRSHAKFAELLLEQIADSLTEPTQEELLDELRALDLLKYCRTALERRSKRE
jgi:RNA polymerase sigma-70 factor (ECF subfamily)